ncbi:MAG: multiheme c-type cytochrome [Thermodesulfobacteriota bacterium]
MTIDNNVLITGMVIKEIFMKKAVQYFVLFFFVLVAVNERCNAAPVSTATQECLDCHTVIHPGIVEDWKQSRHARMTAGEAAAVKGSGLKVSGKSIPAELQSVAVGCAECHTLRPAAHKDTIDHMGHEVHMVVSPKDCGVCHAEEDAQYAGNIMAHAYRNLAENPVYNALEQSIIGKPERDGDRVRFNAVPADTRADACYYCHGTRLQISGFETRETDMGEMQFPVITGWPNQGVGRVNLDDSRGSCTACHTRHAFSIEMARKPYTCKECHAGPDVPAYKVYSASKHGNIFAAMHLNWDFQVVPWTVGKDFQAPTCAACHVSLLVNTEGTLVAKRTHRMSDRLPWRIFGLIYAHPQPREPDTTLIRNKDGLPLPTDFSGAAAADFLIDADTLKKRTETMQAVCRSCHDDRWVRGHWQRLDHTIAETNAATAAATGIMADVWKRGLAQGLDRGASPFDEGIEKIWTDTWLLYANTIRFSSAMAGGGDYGVFADGRYFMTRRILELNDWLDLRLRLLPSKEPPAPEQPR